MYNPYKSKWPYLLIRQLISGLPHGLSHAFQCLQLYQQQHEEDLRHLKHDHPLKLLDVVPVAPCF